MSWLTLAALLFVTGAALIALVAFLPDRRARTDLPEPTALADDATADSSAERATLRSSSRTSANGRANTSRRSPSRRKR